MEFEPRTSSLCSHSEPLTIAQIKQTNSQCVSSYFSFWLIINHLDMHPNSQQTTCMQYITKPTDTRMKTKLNNLKNFGKQWDQH